MVFKNFTQLALKQFDRVLTRDFTARYRPDGRVSRVKIDSWLQPLFVDIGSS